MSFFATFDRIVPGQNKYMAGLWNGTSTRKIAVNRIYRYNWQQAAVTGVLLEQELRRLTSRSSATSVPILLEETNDAVTSGVLAETNHVSPVDGVLISRLFASSEEYVLATSTAVVTGNAALLHDSQLVYWRKDGSKGIVLRPSEGIGIKNITNSTVGSVSYIIEFDDVPL